MIKNIFTTKIEKGSRDFYASDDTYGTPTLKCVPAGGYAPKRTRFVARVNPNGEMIVLDDTLTSRLDEWLKVEILSEMAALAAEEGRYCHGNGNYFIFVDGNELVTVSLCEGTIDRKSLDDEFAKNYIRNSRPYKSLETAESLRNHAASKFSKE